MIPHSIYQSLERLDISVLYEIRGLIENLIREREKYSAPEDLSKAREILKVKRSGSVTYRLELVSCGKNCKGCPHGPYWYSYWRDGNKTRSKYIGKNLRQKL